jgi:DNA polymerase V
MTELLTLDLVEKNLVTNQIVLTIGYDIENVTSDKIGYKGEITIDRYGRKVPKHAHGTINLDHQTSSTKIIMDSTMKLYERIINKDLLVRRINVTAENVINMEQVEDSKSFEQIDLFTDYHQKEEEEKEEKKERELQKAVIEIKNKYGKNAIIKGMNLQDAGTTIDRNKQVGGHKA